MKVRVRRVDATRRDIAQCLAALQKEILPDDTPRAIEGDEWWLAFSGIKVVGFASMNLIPTDDGFVAYLSRSGVRSGARGNGVQKRMIRARVAHARRAGAFVSIVDTCDNPPSANSLISEGFRMYDPQYPWALERSVYWRRDL